MRSVCRRSLLYATRELHDRRASIQLGSTATRSPEKSGGRVATVVPTPHRSLAFKRPPGPARPRPFELAVARLEASLAGSTPLWDFLASAVPVYGCGGEKKTRERRLRSDGARNLVTFLQTLVMNSDPRGFLGWPSATGWKRVNMALLDYRAFGEKIPNARSQRRSERIARALGELGLLRTREIRMQRQDRWESVIAVRHLTEKAWRLLGVWDALQALRRKRDQEEKQTRARELASIGRTGLQVFYGGPRQAAAAAGQGRDRVERKVEPARPPPPVPPPRAATPESVKRHLDEIRNIFNGQD